jgi:hypothetical protein
VLVEFGGAVEGSGGFIVIEGVDETEALIEELLSFGVPGGDRWWRELRPSIRKAGFGAAGS